jgi:IS30 family transposase
MSNTYDAGLYTKYNNYGFSDKSIADVINYLANQILPTSLNTSQKRTRFKQKWSKDWEMRNGKLVYTPLNLTVVPDGERDTILKGIYEDIKQDVGQGIDVFYKRIRDKYLNIWRSDVGTFLKSQKVYQITRPQNHIINKPILEVSPNNRWGIDSINMVSYASSNEGIDAGYKFILTVCDYFSRKTWLRALKSQTAVNVRNALINIVVETKTYPRIIQADNGSEFEAETSQWMKDNDIIYIKTLSYSPESNGLVEGTNKKIRNVLREIMFPNIYNNQ